MAAVFMQLHWAVTALLWCGVLYLLRPWLGHCGRLALRRHPRAPGARRGHAAAYRTVLWALLLLGAGVSSVGLHSPLAGLLLVGVSPVVYRLWCRWRLARAKESLEASVVLFFHALSGLVHSGLDLSAALFVLSKSQQSVFAAELAAALGGFEQGRALDQCLSRCARRAPTPLVKTCLGALQMAYAQGVPVGPVLERMVPALEQEQDANRRVRDLRRGALAQALVAAAVPWCVVVTMACAQPELAARLWALPAGRVVLAAAVLANALGVRVLWKTSAFE